METDKGRQQNSARYSWLRCIGAGAYPNGESGDSVPGLEPTGASTLNIDVAVNDGGIASFSYMLKTWDTGSWDWYDISIQTPAGIVSLVSHLGKPGNDYGTFFESPEVPLAFDLSPYKNQRVTFIFSVQQDGWGDQTAGEIAGFNLRTCQVPPLAPLTDPAALRFESGDKIDEADLVPAMQTALGCVRAAVSDAGGSFFLLSAYRPVQYQSHIREVWDKWRLLRDRREPECLNLRTVVQNEFEGHKLLISQRPASSGGPHTLGLAIDIQSTLPIQQLLDSADQCQLYRPLPATDPVHFIHQ